MVTGRFDSSSIGGGRERIFEEFELSSENWLILKIKTFKNLLLELPNFAALFLQELLLL